MINFEWIERVDLACKDMKRCLRHLEGVDRFIDGIRPLLTLDWAFFLEGGGVVLSDSDQLTLFRRLLKNCQRLQKEFSGLRIKPTDDESDYDTRSSSLLMSAAWSLQREKTREEAKSEALLTGDFESEIASAFAQLKEATDATPLGKHPETNAKDTESRNLPKSTPTASLESFLEQLDAVTEVLGHAVKIYRTSKGNSAGRRTPNIVKARLAEKFVNAYATYFGKPPPIANEGATVDAFQYLCQAAALPRPPTVEAKDEPNFSVVLNKEIRKRIARDAYAKRASEIIDRLNRLPSSL